MNKDIYNKVDQYINDLFVKEDDNLLNTKESLLKAEMPQISVSPVQGKLLHVLVKMCGAKKIIEFGTLAGYSTIWIARALPDNGKIITFELEQKHAQVAQKNIDNAGLSNKVEIKTGNATEVMETIDGVFDMFFLDADKPAYPKHLEWTLKHSRKGSVIIADNVIRQGEILDSESTDEDVKGTQKFNAMLAACNDVSAAVIPTVGIKGYDGIAIAIVE